MAIVVHSTADVTVDTISDRNSIVYKRDNMTVTVIDAIADIDAGNVVLQHTDGMLYWIVGYLYQNPPQRPYHLQQKK